MYSDSRIKINLLQSRLFCKKICLDKGLLHEIDLSRVAQEAKTSDFAGKKNID
jgi:hypothetical protein